MDAAPPPKPIRSVEPVATVEAAQPTAAAYADPLAGIGLAADALFDVPPEPAPPEPAPTVSPRHRSIEVRPPSVRIDERVAFPAPPDDPKAAPLWAPEEPTPFVRHPQAAALPDRWGSHSPTPLPKPKKRSKFVHLAIFVGAGFIILSALSSNNDDAATRRRDRGVPSGTLDALLPHGGILWGGVFAGDHIVLLGETRIPSDTPEPSASYLVAVTPTGQPLWNTTTPSDQPIAAWTSSDAGVSILVRGRGGGWEIDLFGKDGALQNRVQVPPVVGTPIDITATVGGYIVITDVQDGSELVHLTADGAIRWEIPTSSDMQVVAAEGSSVYAADTHMSDGATNSIRRVGPQGTMWEQSLPAGQFFTSAIVAVPRGVVVVGSDGGRAAGNSNPTGEDNNMAFVAFNSSGQVTSAGEVHAGGVDLVKGAVAQADGTVLALEQTHNNSAMVVQIDLDRGIIWQHEYRGTDDPVSLVALERSLIVLGIDPPGPLGARQLTKTTWMLRTQGPG